jgi:hypothetical protein
MKDHEFNPETFMVNEQHVDRMHRDPTSVEIYDLLQAFIELDEAIEAHEKAMQEAQRLQRPFVYRRQNVRVFYNCKPE